MKTSGAVYTIIAISLTLTTCFVNAACSQDWQVLNPGGVQEYSYNAISGTADGTVYAVGTGGIIWYLQNGRWAQMPSGTTVNLNSLWCNPDGIVYAVGNGGTILRLQAGSWVPHAQHHDGKPYVHLWQPGRGRFYRGQRRHHSAAARGELGPHAERHNGQS